MKKIRVFKEEKKSTLKVAIVILFFYSLSLLPLQMLLPLIEEDGLLENLTAIFFFITSICFFLLFMYPNLLRKSKRRALFTTKNRRYVFLLLSLVFFFGFGEEISWGQRIFGFTTPESLTEVNAQNEFNIHNLEIFNVRDNDGVDRGTLAKLFTMKQLFLYCFFIYLLVVPFLKAYSSKMAGLFRKFYIPVPSIWLGLLFIGNYTLYRVFRIFVDQEMSQDINNGLTEIQEFNFSIILLLVPFSLMRIKIKDLGKRD
jgi:hypothetical protein